MLFHKTNPLCKFPAIILCRCNPSDGLGVIGNGQYRSYPINHSLRERWWSVVWMTHPKFRSPTRRTVLLC